jgi:CubicO group peptidase (beta-lactamase class C family)
MSAIAHMSRRALVLTGLAAGLGRPAFAEGDDWTLAAPDSEHMAGPVLDEILAGAESIEKLRSIVVIRNGMLLAERYYHDASPDDLLAVHSVTKSVSSLLIGLALQRGKIESLSQTVAALLPEETARSPGSPVGRVTLQQILTGTTGLEYDSVRQFDELYRSPDPVHFAFALPNDGRTQPNWRYNDAAVGLIAPILRRATGVPMEEFARQSLFMPLGIDTAIWLPDRQGNARSYAGLQLRTRDLAKIAWTMSNAGRWHAMQVIPAKWVEESLRPRVPVTSTVAPIEDLRYGYLWFTGRMKGRPVAWGWGYGAQFALLVPSLRLAIATACLNPDPKTPVRQNDVVMGVIARIVALAAG